MNAEAQSCAIRSLKASTSRARLPVHREDGSFLGWLAPVTMTIAAERQTIETICRWRSDNMQSFLTVFSPSLEKTRRYLSNVYLPDNGRLLFFVTDDSGRRIGIGGFRDVSAESAELDLVIRGEASPVPRLMMYAQLAMLDWAFRVLNLTFVYLAVLEHNVRARRAYERIGFRPTGVTPLRREQAASDGYRLVPDQHASGGPSLLRMDITFSEFYHRHLFLRQDSE